jgi:hypothetical protein
MKVLSQIKEPSKISRLKPDIAAFRYKEAAFYRLYKTFYRYKSLKNFSMRAVNISN